MALFASDSINYEYIYTATIDYMVTASKYFFEINSLFFCQLSSFFLYFSCVFPLFFFEFASINNSYAKNLQVTEHIICIHDKSTDVDSAIYSIAKGMNYKTAVWDHSIHGQYHGNTDDFLLVFLKKYGNTIVFRLLI